MLILLDLCVNSLYLKTNQETIFVVVLEFVDFSLSDESKKMCFLKGSALSTFIWECIKNKNMMLMGKIHRLVISHFIHF